MTIALIAALIASQVASPGPAAPPGRPPLVIAERDTIRREPPPHGNIGQSTAYRITDGVPGRTMEFRKRSLHGGAAIGVHPIDHDEVYYVVAGSGVVTSGGIDRPVGVGDATYLYAGERVGIRQTGRAPLTLIIAYPLAAPKP